MGGRGDGRTFEQAVRLLERFAGEHDRRLNPVGAPDPDSPIRRAYERIVTGGDSAISAQFAG